MPKIYIECPVKKVAVTTGMSDDNPSKNTWSNNSFKCEKCGEMHTWEGKDAFFINNKGGREPLYGKK